MAYYFTSNGTQKNMNKIKLYVVALMMVTLALTTFSACKKGSDDPVVSLKTRNDRFTNTWTLVKYEKNGVIQDLNGSTYMYSVLNNGTLTRTIEGSIFGFPTRTVKDGTWAFQNDDEDVKITIESDVQIYNIQRLASKELWLRKSDNADTYIYYFEGL